MDSGNTFNIPRHIKDSNYRYTMPKIQVTLQGTGGGVKTKFDNIKDVAHALGALPNDYPLKFLGKELGTVTEIKNDNYLINGSHTADKLQSLLDKFIEKYVLCPNCKLPEIRIVVKKDKGEIRSQCMACGETCKLDSKHKFSNHIKNFPPEYTEEVTRGKPGGSIEGGKKSEAAKKTLDKETKLKIKTGMEKIAKILTMTQEEGQIKATIENMFNELKLDNDIKLFVLINGLFDKNIYQQLKQRVGIVKYFMKKEGESLNEEDMFYVIGGIADFTTNRFKDLVKYIPSILYYLYLDDVITEEFWIKYAVKQTLPAYGSILITQEIQTKFLDFAKEFTDWIENAPYEDEEWSYDPKEAEKETKTVDNKEKKETKKVEEDIDIDNI